MKKKKISTTCSDRPGKTLILGIGNLLMGDEGVGVHALRLLEKHTALPHHVECLDGGTGSFHLLEPLQKADRVILIDAAIDGQPAGTIHRLEPRFSSDYPNTITAHDIGLKDLLDALYLLEKTPKVILFTVSIAPFSETGLNLDMSPEIEDILPDLQKRILAELE